MVPHPPADWRIAGLRIAVWTALAGLGGAAASACRFTEIAAARGLIFVHDAAVEGDYFVPESIGAGGGFVDYDGDGDLDVYLLNGARRRRGHEPPLRNRLFRQEGDGGFVDVTEASGAGDAGYGMGLAAADADGDGDVDLYLTNWGPDAFYRNRGDGSFEEATVAAGLGDRGWGSSAAPFDADGDGDTDLFVARYLDFDPAAVCTDAAGRPDYCGPEGFGGLPDRLYLNRGDGRFLAAGAGELDRRPGKGLGVIAADFDGDARTDLYVANDGEANHLWRGRGGGAFEEVALSWGAALDELGHAQAGMGIAVGDADGDGDEDLFVTHLRGETNTFYRADGDRGFADQTLGAGLASAGRARTGFGVDFLDCDNDGDLDLAIANGRVTRGPLLAEPPAAPEHWHPYAEPNLLLLNDGGGRFRDASAGAGDFTTHVDNSRGLARGDVDGDGRVDLLVTNGGGPARLYRNVGAAGGWLLVSLPGGPETGASVSVRLGPARLARRFRTAASFLSAADPRLHFGLGEARRVEVLELESRGRRVAYRDLAAGRHFVLPAPVPAPSAGP